LKYKIEIRPEAVKDLEQLDSTVARRILKKLNWLKENFDLIVPEPLSGEFKGLYKLRVGNYRVVPIPFPLRRWKICWRDKVLNKF